MRYGVTGKENLMKYGIIAMLAAVLATGVAIARDAGESSPSGMMRAAK